MNWKLLLLLATLLLGPMCAPTLAFGAGFDERFIAATGDLNGDGLLDIYIRQRPPVMIIDVGDLSVPIPRRQDVQPFVLQRRPDGAFGVIAALSTQQRDQVARWPLTPALKLLSSDLNVDGFRDLIVKGVTGAIAGSFDQIVFANTTTGSTAQQARSIDPELISFMKDTYRWQTDSSYFEVASLENNWYQIERGAEYLAYWSLSYLLFWGYTASDGSPLVLSFEAASDPNQLPPACNLYACQFDVFSGVWRVQVVAREMRLVYDNFNEHFDNDAVTYGKGTHASLDVLAQIISGKLQIVVGGAERGLVYPNDFDLEDLYYKDLLLRILLHDNYCAITLECSVEVAQLTNSNFDSVDMVVERLGTGSYLGPTCTPTKINYTHGTYTFTGSNGIALNGFTLERGGPDDPSVSSDGANVCSNTPRRAKAGTYNFTLNRGSKYPNVPRLDTTAINRADILIHNSGGAVGSTGCILVATTSGAGGTFTGGSASSRAALEAIKRATIYQVGGARKFLFNEGTVTIRNNGN